MTELIMPPAWIGDGLCGQADPDAWHPDKGESSVGARRICNGEPNRGTEPCPVRDQCRAWALDHPTRLFGVWGGLTERERRQLRGGEAA